ncbi:MAG: hypothetical protein H0Z35_11750 [Thermoanaerobacteraceae bacterium]|nr:hypothetical protein [Thermoanaerobacteraceae bacterium]
MERSIHFGNFFATLAGLIVILLGEFSGISRLEVNLTVGRLLVVFLFGQVLGYAHYFVIRYFDRLVAWGPWTLGVIYGLILWVLMLPIASASTLIAPVMAKGMPTIITTLVAFISYGVVVANYSMFTIDT